MIKVDSTALILFVCAMIAPVKLQIGAEMYLGEFLLPLLALAIRFGPGGGMAMREKVFGQLVTAGVITLCGYVLSDVVQGSRLDQIMRGWGRIALLLTDFIALTIIFGKDRRYLWWYALGSGLGGILMLRLINNAPLGLWKFGYADPVLMVSAALGWFAPLKAASAWIGLLGLYSMKTDYRSFAGFCFGIAAILWVRAGTPDGSASKPGSLVKLGLAGGVAAVSVFIALSLTGGNDTGRRSESDAGRRAAFETGVEAVIRSPIIGYGSWAESKELSQMYLSRVNKLRGGSGSVTVDDHLVFNPHSQILHAWFEGGILGTAFLVTILWHLMKSGGWLLSRRPVDALTPLLLVVAVNMLWNLFMSPFTGPHRLGIAVGAAMLVLVSIERKVKPATSLASVAIGPVEYVAPQCNPAATVSGRRRVQYAKRELSLSRRSLAIRS
jgi:hypothetical protein